MRRPTFVHAPPLAAPHAVRGDPCYSAVGGAAPHVVAVGARGSHAGPCAIAARLPTPGVAAGDIGERPCKFLGAAILDVSPPCQPERLHQCIVVGPRHVYVAQ